MFSGVYGDVLLNDSGVCIGGVLVVCTLDHLVIVVLRANVEIRNARWYL